MIAMLEERNVQLLVAKDETECRLDKVRGDRQADYLVSPALGSTTERDVVPGGDKSRGD